MNDVQHNASLPSTSENAWACLLGMKPVWNRDAEASLVGAVVDAVAQHRAPESDREADV